MKKETKKEAKRMRTTNNYNVKVNRIHALEDAGNVKAYADITINEVISIKGCKLVEYTDKSGNTNVFTAGPQQPYKDKEGKTAYSAIVYINDEKLNDDITSAILEELDE